MKVPLVADTGGLLRALMNTPDGLPTYPEFAEALTSARFVIVPSLILPEVDYFLRERRAVMRKLVAEILDPGTTYELDLATPADLVRALVIDAKFSDLKIGLVDATVAAVCERRRVYRVLTTDRRHFSAIRVGLHYSQPLTPVP